MGEKNFKLGERVFVDNSGVVGVAGNGWGGSEGVVTHEHSWRGNVRIRLDKVPEQLKSVHDQIDGLWCYPNHVKRVESKFEIGDRVEREKPKNEVPSPCELHLSFVGNATTMSLVDADGNVECSATARCHPNDDFDVGTGMKIAFERLYERYRKHNPDHSAIMIGDKVRLKKGATLPLITRYGNSDNPSEIILNEAGVVEALSLNSKNAIVGWRENVVAVAETSDLEIEREKKEKPKFREGDILVTRKNGCYVRVTKDFCEWEEKVPFETAYEVCGELTPDNFVGKLDDNNRVDVGDMVEATEDGVRYRGMVVMVTPRKKSPWIRDVLIKGIASGNTPMQKLIREDLVRPLFEREPFVGESVFVLNSGVMHDHALCWYNDDSARVNGGKFCVLRGWYTNLRTRQRFAIVEHNDGKAKVNPKHILLRDWC